MYSYVQFVRSQEKSVGSQWSSGRGLLNGTVLVVGEVASGMWETSGGRGWECGRGRIAGCEAAAVIDGGANGRCNSKDIGKVKRGAAE